MPDAMNQSAHAPKQPPTAKQKKKEEIIGGIAVLMIAVFDFWRCNSDKGDGTPAAHAQAASPSVDSAAPDSGSTPEGDDTTSIPQTASEVTPDTRVLKGIFAALRQLERGTISAKELKQALVRLDTTESSNGGSPYVVENPVAEFVIYRRRFSDEAYDLNPSLAENPVRFAIPKRADQFYPEGAKLKDGPLFQFLGIQTFTTVGGTEAQIPVFKPLPKR